MDGHDKRTVPVTPPVTAAASASSETGAETVNKKKRGATKTSRRAGDVEKRVSKAMSRIAKAADKAMTRYNKRRDDSDTKRKDGALRDMPENLMRSAAKAAAQATPAVGDIMKLAYTKSNRKMMRQNLGRLPMPFMQ
mgnify:CR=1 FL=1|jgi:hypothetical protein